MTRVQWEIFCKFREDFKKKVFEWDARIPELKDYQKEAAKIAEDDFRTKIEKARELLTPILLLFATVLTAGIICTVMAPLFDLFTAIPEY